MQGRIIRVTTLARHVIRAALLAGVVVITALISMTASGSSSATATSRVAVSDEVVWPFYASTREELLQVADDPSVHEAVRSAFGTVDGGIELDAEPSNGEIVVELTATSADAAVAVQAANLYADEVVAVGAARTAEVRARSVADLNTEIEQIDARLAANDARLAELGAAIDALGDDPVLTQQAVLQSQIQQIESSQREDARRRTELVQGLSSAEVAVDRVDSDFSVIRRADTADESFLDNPLLIALLAGIPVFLIGLGASIVWDQTFGRVRRPEDVRWVSDAPVSTAGYRGDRESPDAVSDTNSFARRMTRHQIPGSRWLLVPLGATPTALAEALAAAVTRGSQEQPPEPRDDSRDRDDDLDRDQVRTTDVGRETSDERRPPRGSGTTTLATPTRGDSTTLQRLVVGSLASIDQEAAGSVSGAVLVFERGKVRVPTLRRAIQDLDVDGLPLEMVVLLDERRR